MTLTTTWPSLGCTRLWPKKELSLCRCYLKCFPWSSHRPHCEPSHCIFQRKDFPSYSFYVVVVVKTEDEACGGPLRYYPLRPDELFDAGNRTKVLDIVVSPAINCKSWFRPPRDMVCVCGLVQLHLLPSAAEVYVMGMLFCLGIFLSFYLLTLLVACVENKR